MDETNNVSYDTIKKEAHRVSTQVPGFSDWLRLKIPWNEICSIWFEEPYIVLFRKEHDATEWHQPPPYILTKNINPCDNKTMQKCGSQTK